MRVVLTYLFLLSLGILFAAAMLALVAYFPAIQTEVRRLSENPESMIETVRGVAEGVAVGVVGNVVYAALLYAFGFISSLLLVKKRVDIRIKIIVTRMTRSMETVLRDQALPPFIAAKKIVLLREDGLNRLDRISSSLNSDLETLASLVLEAEALRATKKPMPAHLARRIEEVLAVLRDTWPERKSRLNSSVEQLVYFFGEGRPDNFGSDDARR
jgi:hypothetical protein